MRLKSFITIISISVMLMSTAFATQLPKEVKDFVINQNDVPSIRFDGLISYSDGTMYIPVIPVNYEPVDKVEIKSTYPKNTPFAKKPDIVIFNNSYSLLKIAKNKDGFLTVSKIDEIPFELRTGLIPQDMLVPSGLVFPANLRCVLGNVQIPVLNEYSVAEAERKAGVPLPTGKKVNNKKVNVNNEIKNKLFFVNNYQSPYLMVFSPNVSEPLFELKTSDVIKDIKPAMGGKYLLVASANLKNVDVIDVKNEYVARRIDLADVPSEIAVDDIHSKAYVASLKSNVISVIDMNTMTMKEKIQLIGAPQKMVLTEDGQNLIYVDKITSAIYIMGLTDGNYENRFVANVPNLTKMLVKNNVIYLISRTKPEVIAITYDLNAHYEVVKTKAQRKAEKEAAKLAEKENEDVNGLVSGFDPDVASKKAQFDLSEKPVSYATSTDTVPTGNKPIDMVLYNDKLYVLSAEKNAIYTYKINPSLQADGTIPTQLGGFSTSINQAGGIALIMNMTDHHYSVVDLNREKVINIIPINKAVNSVTVTERL